MAVEGNGGLTHRYAHYGSCVGALGIRILRGANGVWGEYAGHDRLAQDLPLSLADGR